MDGRSVCGVARGARTRDDLARERDGWHAVARDVLRSRFTKGDRGRKDDVACGQGIKTQTGSSVRQLERVACQVQQLDQWPKEEGEEKKSLKVFT